MPFDQTRTLPLLDTSITHSPQTARSVEMLTHIPDRPRLYAVAVAAALLAVLALIGLFTELLSMRQILFVAVLLMLAIELLAVRDRRSRR
jgi:hypothetical protein